MKRVKIYDGQSEYWANQRQIIPDTYDAHLTINNSKQFHKESVDNKI